MRRDQERTFQEPTTKPPQNPCWTKPVKRETYLEFKPKNDGGTNTGSRLFATIVAVCETEGQQKTRFFAQLKWAAGSPK
jgi:hypothetical protein